MQEQINKYITNSPFLLQIAKDEKWEDNWSINVNTSITTDEIDKYLNRDTFKDLAIEAFFKEKDGIYVLGLEYNKSFRTQSPHNFIATFIELTKNYESFNSYIESINNEILGFTKLFEGEPDKIRVGVVNHWFSIGPCLIWEKGNPKNISENQLESLTNQKPEVKKTKLNYQGMSFVYNIENEFNQPCHWMKSPCSNYTNGIWNLNNKLILKFLAEWQGFKVD